MIAAILLMLAVQLGMKDTHIVITSGETVSLACQLEAVEAEWGAELWRTIDISDEAEYQLWSLECYLSVCSRLDILPVSVIPEVLKD